MIQAFKKHKISSEIREQLWNREDAKTSSIIGTLSLLPAQQFWSIIRRACSNANELPENATELNHIDFWPQWKLDGRVEPDVFVRFKEFDLIIELKRNDGNQQDTDQWNREINAYRSRYMDSHKEVYLVAISGRTEKQHPHVFQCSWSNLLKSVETECENIQGHCHVARILKTAITAFHIHHEYSYSFLETMTNVKINIPYEILNTLWTI